MFTGIIESLGKILQIEQEGKNFHFTIQSSISHELKIDQSLSHDGVCLTVVELAEDWHKVTAVEETMLRSNLMERQIGDSLNLERAMRANDRLDGHIVQGHVDGKAISLAVEEAGGSWYYRFRYTPGPAHLLVDKGSICINGVSLTVINPEDDQFSVAIIPYTYEHTNFNSFTPGTAVNLEFDIIGKYIARYMEVYKSGIG